MKELLSWLSEQKKEKGFRILLFVMFVISIGLIWEFCFFEYSILKILRLILILWGISFLAWMDFKEKRISNQILLTLFLMRTILLFFEILNYPGYWLTIIISSASGFSLGGGIFLLCYLISKGGIGAGDVKLMAVLGFYLGMNGVFTCSFLSIVCAAAYSILLLILRKVNLKEEIAFAPFVLVGVILTIGLGV